MPNLPYVIAIDPGSEESAVICYDGVARCVRSHRIDANRTILDMLYTEDWSCSVLVIEQIESMGQFVGKATFETVFWSGRFAETCRPRACDRVTRHAVKLHLLGMRKGTDQMIKAALIDRFGGTSEAAIGKKATPGPLFGLRGHELSALAVAVTWFDDHGQTPVGEPLRPGIDAQF